MADRASHRFPAIPVIGQTGARGACSRGSASLALASGLQSSTGMRPFLTLALVAPVAGCFFTETINARPAAELTQIGGQVGRGGTLTVAVHTADPDGDDVTVQLRAQACDASGARCGAAFDTTSFIGGEREVDFVVPLDWDDGGASRPVEAVRVIAQAVDPLGAPLLLDQSLLVPVGNLTPTVVVQPQGYTYRGSYPVGAPIDLVAAVADGDDADDTLVVSWQLFPPRGADPQRTVFGPVDSDVSDGEVTHQLVSDVDGNWEVAVTVTDPLGAASTLSTTLVVAPDQLPCLTTLAPAAPPSAGAVLPLTELRRFAVLVVEDDLDLFPPPPPGDPLLGAATFTWAVASPASGDQFVPVPGASGNAVELDPAQFTAGQLVRLRVEVQDRQLAPSGCPVEQPTCGTLTCTQRQTWTLEVR
jgi:hypothetical protein